MPTRRRALLILLGLAFLALGSLGVALAVGSVALGPGELAALLVGGEGPAADIVWQLRLPRALAGFACGGLLALAGALMQSLLRNPLADPYVLGVSGGAGVGALVAMLLGLAAGLVDALAFAGALAAMLAVFGIAHGDGSWTQTRLLLTGVIVAAGCGAFISLLLALAPEASLRGMLFWLMGDLSPASEWRMPLVVLGSCLLLCLPLARELNLLARGLLEAQALGVAVGRLRFLVYFLAALATATAVTTAGAIGFVGLLVPHGVRLLAGGDQRLLLPASVLAGGALLVAADTLARTVVAPQQLPVGVLTALIGVPVFLLVLARQPR
ncbi:MAG: iron ABC transporter permease [Azonexus sp.]|nr:iron ABC transporter permease [Betaproteobacteria bacterium]MBK8919752.1 iron ABC transporter permease [Betaproteobacteria bacterium]MBP6034997.1 iron ABC transporter permease [Azonexus sp.]MBP6905703.1 iron ABC transporter permease [Azonexus sp.]